MKIATASIGTVLTLAQPNGQNLGIRTMVMTIRLYA
jgi:hypothetical protein